MPLSLPLLGYCSASFHARLVPTSVLARMERLGHAPRRIQRAVSRMLKSSRDSCKLYDRKAQRTSPVTASRCHYYRAAEESQNGRIQGLTLLSDSRKIQARQSVTVQAALFPVHICSHVLMHLHTGTSMCIVLSASTLTQWGHINQAMVISKGLSSRASGPSQGG